MLSAELAIVLAFCLPCSQLCRNHSREQFFCLDKRNLNITMGVAVQTELALYILRQRLQNSQIFRCNVALNERNLLILRSELAALTCSRICQYLVQLGNQFLDCGNEFNQTLRDKNSTEVVTISSTVSNNLSQICYYIIQRHLLLLYFLRNKTCIWLSL